MHVQQLWARRIEEASPILISTRPDPIFVEILSPSRYLAHIWCAASSPFFLKKYGPSPAPFSVYFQLFKQMFQILQQINVKKFHPVYGAGIWTHALIIANLISLLAFLWNRLIQLSSFSLPSNVPTCILMYAKSVCKCLINFFSKKVNIKRNQVTAAHAWTANT